MKDKRCALLLIVFFTLSCSFFYPGCTREDDEITIMTWNVENLFDDINNGTEYSDFIPGEENWTTEDFHGKMAALAEAVDKIISHGPDILLLQEIENENVLNTFAAGYLQQMHYHWCYFNKDEEQAAGTAVLSRYPLEKLISHQSDNPDYASGRPIMEIQLTIEENKLIIFNNHWKSKSGGALETEPARNAAAAILNKRIGELVQSSPGTPIIIAGDLNETLPGEEGAPPVYLTALTNIKDFEAFQWAYSGQESSALWFQYLDQPDTSIPPELPVLPLLTPWLSGDKTCGSYFYREQWEKIDHFLMSQTLRNGQGIEFKDFMLCNQPFLQYPNGGPIRWDRDRGEGYSDHLPLLLTLTITN